MCYVNIFAQLFSSKVFTFTCTFFLLVVSTSELLQLTVYLANKHNTFKMKHYTTQTYNELLEKKNKLKANTRTSLSQGKLHI